MNTELYPMTATALQELLVAFNAFQAAMRAEFAEGSTSPAAPAVMLIAHDPERGGSDFKLAGDSYQMMNSLAYVLSAQQPLYQEMNRELLRLLAWHKMNHSRQN